MDAPASRAIVAVRNGKQAYTRRVLEVGQRLTVGRSDDADLQIHKDKQLLGVHFGVSWDGRQAMVHHLARHSETLCNGLARLQDEVPHGAVLQAGETFFSFYVEGAARALLRRQAGAALPDVQTHPLRVARRELESSQRFYAVLDAARDPRIMTLLLESVERSHSLYEGTEGQVMDEVAPFLVELPADSDLLDALLQLGWGQAWGIYLASERPFDQVRRALRRLLMVDDEAGKSFYFRFYDPRVLSMFMPIITPRQRFQLFDDIAAYWCEDGEALMHYRGD